MIVINGYKFAEKESEIVDSLFQKNGTVSGKAKRFKRKIMFYNIQGNPFAVITCKNVIGSALKLDGGKIWYGYGTPFFLENVSYSKAHNITEALAVRKDSKGLIFKEVNQ